MSKNSKNAQRIIKAREMSATHKNGGKGPAKTTAKHGKQRAWWQINDREYRTFVKGKPVSKQTEESVAQFIKRKQPARVEA